MQKMEIKNPGLMKRKSSVMMISPSAIEEIAEELRKINQFDFNIFEVNDILDKKTLLYMTYEVFTRMNFFDSILNENIYKNFIKRVIDGYNREVPYHNDLHAADVFQTTFVMFDRGSFVKPLQLKKIDIFSILLAAICHDLRHPGKNNLFQINSKSDLAITYNGKFYVKL
jgi:hypothetical protein